jgi:hypothetical protein
MHATTRAVLTAVFAALVAVASYAHSIVSLKGLGEHLVVFVAVLLALVLAAGWPVLLRLPNVLGSGVVIALGGAGAVLAVAGTRGDPVLRWLPVVLALAILLAFVNELARQDGRRRLVDSVAGTVTGVLVATATAGWVAAQRAPGGTSLVVAGAVSLAFAACFSAMHLGDWIVAGTTVAVGVLVGAAVGGVMPDTDPIIGGLVGLATGLLTAALDALFDRLPALRRRSAAMASVVLPVSVSGIVVYVVGRVLVG